MSIIQRAVSEMRWRIPVRMLEMTFLDQLSRYQIAPTSIEERIMELVVRPRVLYDMNVVGGVELRILLDGIPKEEYDQFESVYYIPKTMTNGRSILTPLSLSYLSHTVSTMYRNAAYCGRSGVAQGAQALLASQADIPRFTNHLLDLVGENAVRVRGSTVMPPNVELRCIVAYDENLSNFSIRSTSAFVKLVELAVKAFIFNKMEWELDRGYVQGGVQLETAKNIVDRYADSNELYDEHLNKIMAKVAHLQDHESMSRLIKLRVGAGYR